MGIHEACTVSASGMSKRQTYTYGRGIKHRTNSTNTTRNLFLPLVATTPPHPPTFMLNSLPRRHTLKRSPTVSVAWLRMLFSNIALNSDT